MDTFAADWNFADWVMVGVVGLSTLFSLLRGFTREALSVLTWVVALLGGRILAPSLAILFAGMSQNPQLREWAAFACLFTAILVVGMLLTHVISDAVLDSPLSAGDRVLGMAFGFTRGVLACVAAVSFGSTWLSAENWWQQSIIIPHLSLLESWVRDSGYAIAGWVGH